MKAWDAEDEVRATVENRTGEAIRLLCVYGATLVDPARVFVREGDRILLVPGPYGRPVIRIEPAPKDESK